MQADLCPLWASVSPYAKWELEASPERSERPWNHLPRSQSREEGWAGARSSPLPRPEPPSPGITSLGKYLLPPRSCLLLPVPLLTAKLHMGT